MAEATPAPKAVDPKVTEEAPRKERDTDVFLVDLSTPEKIVEYQLDVLRKEAEKRDDTDGPADNVSGDQSEKFADHVKSMDPFKKAFPPGPDDITKLGKTS